MKLIVLDTEDPFEFDGFSRLLLENPTTGATILEEYEKEYAISKIDIVVGYNAIKIINKFPKYNYIYNQKWQSSNYSYNLSLALTEESCLVTGNNFFIKKSLVDKISKFENCIVIKDNENKTLNASKIKIKNGEIESIYYGESSGDDFELLEIFKITEHKILQQWKKNCLLYPNKKVGENLPFLNQIKIIKATKDELVEINSIQDYIRLTESQNV